MEDWLAGRMKRLNMPVIDVHDAVMARIAANGDAQSQRRAGTLARKPVVMAALIALLVVGSGFATLSFIELRSDSGSVTLTLRQHDRDNDTPAELDRDKYLSRIAPGEAIAVYEPTDNPQRIVKVLDKPLAIGSYDELLRKSDGAFPLPSSLPEPYRLSSASISYEPEQAAIAAVHERVRNDPNAAVAQPVPLSERAYGVLLNVELPGSGTIAVSMLNGRSGNSAWFADLNAYERVRHVNVHNNEGLLYERDGRTELIWREAEQGIHYTLSTDNADSDAGERLTALLDRLLSAS